MKTQKRVGKIKQAKAAPLATQEVKAETTPIPQVTELEYPPPEFLLNEAMNEPDRRLIGEYGETIRLLRNDKRFTFREIAEWLQEYGIECDHNSVYREYTKGLSFEDEREVALQSSEEEREES
jgi:hypothetical protein